MPNSWGRPPRNNYLWQDLQSLAFWVMVLGLLGYILFPEALGGMYSRLSEPAVETADTGVASYDPDMNPKPYEVGSLKGSAALYPTYINPVTSAMYNLGNEVSAGYWVLFVAEGDFKQLPLTGDAHQFLLRLIERDKGSVGKNTVILTANGQIKKYMVSDEVYTIITSLAAIDTRSRSG